MANFDEKLFILQSHSADCVNRSIKDLMDRCQAGCCVHSHGWSEEAMSKVDQGLTPKPVLAGELHDEAEQKLLRYNAKDVAMTVRTSGTSPGWARTPAASKYVGYWRDWAEPDLEDEGELPWPGDSVDESWDAAERAAVIKHLQAGKPCRGWRGLAQCRLCGERLGSCDMTDGLWVWPQKLEHYLLVHHVRLPVEFVEHVKEFGR